MNKEQLAAKIAALRQQQPTTPEPTQTPIKVPEKAKKQEPTPEPIPTQENKTNLSETPQILKQLLGIVETIEESQDTTKTSLLKASEQVEKCKAYILYLRSILPILEAKTEALIEAKHKPQPIKIQSNPNFNLN